MAYLGARHKVIQFPIYCSLRHSFHSPGVTCGLQAYHHTLSIFQSRLHSACMLKATPTKTYCWLAGFRVQL